MACSRPTRKFLWLMILFILKLAPNWQPLGLELAIFHTVGERLNQYSIYIYILCGMSELGQVHKYALYKLRKIEPSCHFVFCLLCLCSGIQRPLPQGMLDHHISCPGIKLSA